MHSKEDSDPNNKYVYRDNTCVSKENCMKCDHNIGMMQEGFAKCNRHKDKNTVALVHCLPAQYLKNFTNGEMVVMCKNENKSEYNDVKGVLK